MESFQEEAREGLERMAQQAEQQKTLSPSLLSQLLTRGEALGIAVPELDLLRVVSPIHVCVVPLFSYYIHLVYCKS